MNKSIDFYIVGAPKCGTTAFDAYLNQHPKISMLPKELHFWGNDVIYREGKITKKDYVKAIEKNSQKDTLLGEGAVWYLASKTAAKELKDFTPEAKVLIFLRNPVEAVYSLYYNALFNGDEEIDSFEEALANQENRKSNLPKYYNCPSFAFQYQSIYLYYEQVKRYIEVFGKDNVNVCIYEDFVSNQQATYNTILSFLGLESFEIDFKQINKNKEIRSEEIRKFITQPSGSTKGVFKLLIPYKPLREKIKRFVWSINSKETNRPPMQKETKQLLIDFYKEDIIKLEQLIDKDLSIWK